MSGPIFTVWFNDQLHSELKAYCKAENMDFKNLLMLDNAPGHLPVIQTILKHIKVIFLPPNTTPFLQPMGHSMSISTL
jgi:hypothetical protein